MLTSEHTREYLKELGSSVNTLLDGRPDLQNQFKNGLNDTTTWQYNADKAREREAVNEAADVSGGLAGRFVAKIVAPQTVEPKGPPPLTKEEAFDPLRGAIDRYNADPAHKGHSLPQPSDPNALRMRGDGPTAKYNQTGTMLQFDVGGGEREYAMYAMHNGRGSYTLLDPVKDLHSVPPNALDSSGHDVSLVDRQVNLSPNGVVTPAHEVGRGLESVSH